MADTAPNLGWSWASGTPFADSAAVAGTETPPPSKPSPTKPASKATPKAATPSVTNLEVPTPPASSDTRIDDLIKSAKDKGIGDLLTFEAPKPFEPPKEEDPRAVFGSTAAIIASLGSLFTRTPLTNSLRALSDSMKAVKEGNDQNYQKAFGEWKANSELASKRFEWEKSQVDIAQGLIQQGKTNEAIALLKTKAAVTKDPISNAFLDAGDLEGFMKRQDLLEQAHEKLVEHQDSVAERFATLESSENYRKSEYQKQLTNEFVKANGRQPNAQELGGLIQQTEQTFSKPSSTTAKGITENLQMGVYTDLLADAVKKNGGNDISNADKQALWNQAQVDPQAVDLGVKTFIQSGGAMTSLGLGGLPLRTAILRGADQFLNKYGMTVGDLYSQGAKEKAGKVALDKIQTLTAQVENFSNTASKNADLALGLAPKGADPTGVPVLNKWVQAGRVGISGNPDVTKFNAAIQTFANEYASVMSNTSGGARTTDSARQEAMGLIDKAFTLDQLQGTISTLQQEMDNRKSSLKEEYSDLQSMISSPIQSASGGQGGPVEGQTYHDADGNYAIYRNGQYDPIPAPGQQ